MAIIVIVLIVVEVSPHMLGWPFEVLCSLCSLYFLFSAWVPWAIPFDSKGCNSNFFMFLIHAIPDKLECLTGTGWQIENILRV